MRPLRAKTPEITKNGLLQEIWNAVGFREEIKTTVPLALRLKPTLPWKIPNSFPTLAVSSHPPLPPWTSTDILCSESVWETDGGSNRQHWCRLVGERSRRCFRCTLRALGWDESCFLKCLFSLTREWPEDGSNIHLLDLSAGEMGTLPPLWGLVGV